MDLYSVRQQLSMGVPLSQIKLRVIDYSRVSTNRLEQKNSLQNQEEYFGDMIRQNPNWTYVNSYVDDGISGGTDYKRDCFMQMIDDAKEGKFDLIVTKEVSRFARNTLDSIKYTRELLKYGVAVLFFNDNINTALPDSELRLAIMSSMAQDEIRRLSERVKFGMNMSIKKGNILGNDLMYGYKKDKETKNLTIIENEAEYIKEMYTMYAIDNKSAAEISDIFNKRGIKTRRGKKWSTSSIIRMLKNPKYKGYYCAKKSEIIDYMTKKVKLLPKEDWVIYEDKVRIPPIVDEELWNRANERLQERSKKFGDDYKDKLMYQNRYPLSAKIYCSEHNEVFHRRQHCKASNDITWLCARYLKKGKSVCNSPNIRESELNKIIDDLVNEFSINLKVVSDMLLELYKNNVKNGNLDNEIQKLVNSKEKILLKKDKILELNIEGSLSNEEFNERNNGYNIELTQIAQKIVEIEKNKQNFNEIDSTNKKLEKILNQKTKSDATRNKLIELLVQKIVVSRINNEEYNYELNIFVNFSKKYVDKMKNSTLNPCVNGMQNFMRKSYEFKRGFNTKGTKRYIVKYQVNTYICI